MHLGQRLHFAKIGFLEILVDDCTIPADGQRTFPSSDIFLLGTPNTFVVNHFYNLNNFQKQIKKGEIKLSSFLMQAFI